MTLPMMENSNSLPLKSYEILLLGIRKNIDGNNDYPVSAALDYCLANKCR